VYSLVPEKPLRLVYEPFYLAIRRLKLFYEFIKEYLVGMKNVFVYIKVSLKSGRKEGA